MAKLRQNCLTDQMLLLAHKQQKYFTFDISFSYPAALVFERMLNIHVYRNEARFHTHRKCTGFFIASYRSSMWRQVAATGRCEIRRQAWFSDEQMCRVGCSTTILPTKLSFSDFIAFNSSNLHQFIKATYIVACSEKCDVKIQTAVTMTCLIRIRYLSILVN